MLRIEVETIIRAQPAAVWRAWRPGFPVRPREEESRNLNLYPLAYGLKIPVTLVSVNEMRNWTLEHALPRGKLVIDHWMSSAEGGVRVGKRYEVHGPLSIGYRLLAPKIRAMARAEFAELELAASRAPGSLGG
ncbi:MAG TPA: hypothetical protein VJT78_12465 [Candidatus Dormibacteraeota bacterium]|nr:hypothetical protein [Candidatus Dormibacteraeota bacterium]